MTYLRGLLPLDPVKHARFKSATQYGFTFPNPSYPIDRTGGLTDLGMGGNGPDPTLTVNNGQPVGDCGVCAVPMHANMITAVLAGQDVTKWTMTSDQVVELYFKYTNGQDTGVDLGDWLLWLFNQGLIKGFVKLSLSEMDAALSLGLVVVTGVDLNPQAETQFPNWSLGPNDLPDSQDGHAILYGYAETAEGPFKWASWGQWATSDLAWKQHCPQQAFGVITDPDLLASNGFPVDSLLADLRVLGGSVVPAAPVEPSNPAPAVITPPKDSEGILGDVEREYERLRTLVDKEWKKREELTHVLSKALLQAIEQEAYDVILQALRVGISDL